MSALSIDMYSSKDENSRLFCFSVLGLSSRALVVLACMTLLAEKIRVLTLRVSSRQSVVRPGCRYRHVQFCSRRIVGKCFVSRMNAFCFLLRCKFIVSFLLCLAWLGWLSLACHFQPGTRVTSCSSVALSNCSVLWLVRLLVGSSFRSQGSTGSAGSDASGHRRSGRSKRSKSRRRDGHRRKRSASRGSSSRFSMSSLQIVEEGSEEDYSK